MNSQASSALVETCRETVRSWHDPRILAVYLYGSVIRGNSRADSDLDVAILGSEEGKISQADEAQFMDSLERATHHAVDLRMIRDCSPSHQGHILGEGLLVWTANPEAVQQYQRDFLQAHAEQLRVPPSQWQDFLKRLSEKAGAQR